MNVTDERTSETVVTELAGTWTVTYDPTNRAQTARSACTPSHAGTPADSYVWSMIIRELGAIAKRCADQYGVDHDDIEPWEDLHATMTIVPPLPAGAIELTTYLGDPDQSVIDLASTPVELSPL